MRHRAPSRADRVQPAIVAALRAAGCSVQSLGEVGNGCPDLLVARAGQTWAIEVKQPDAPNLQRTWPPELRSFVGALDPRLRAEQAQWHATWRGRLAVVDCVEGALAAVGLLAAEGAGGGR